MSKRYALTCGCRWWVWILIPWGLLGPVGAVAGEFSAAITAISDYDYRGVTQTANRPALQLQTDYYGGPIHAEIWTSNVQFDSSPGAYDSAHTEIAYSADVSMNRDGWLRYNAGFNYATYPGLHPDCDYAEIWGTAAHGSLSASLHYAWDYCDVRPQLGAYYGEINGTWPVPGTHFAAVAHVGLSWGPYWTATNSGAYADYGFGFSASWRRVTVLAEGVNTHGYESIDRWSAFSGKAKLLVSLSVAFSSASD